MQLMAKPCRFFFIPPKVSIVYPHPSDSSRPLFYILDSVHILTCIRNNWLNQKSDGKCVSFFSFYFDNTATCSENDSEYALVSFDALRKLHDVESDSMVKYSYRLSVKVLSTRVFMKFNQNTLYLINNKLIDVNILKSL